MCCYLLSHDGGSSAPPAAQHSATALADKQVDVLMEHVAEEEEVDLSWCGA